MDEGVDSGDILSQREVAIEYTDTARSLYNKITDTALRQIEDFMPQLENNTFERIPQDHKQTNYWRKRSKGDGKIDFKAESRVIYNLVRALSEPYPGAHVLYKDTEVKVWEAQEAQADKVNGEPGKVIQVWDRRILVKCKDNAILLTRHEFDKMPKEGEFLS
jgi:methionyl-tRNA formyltransferase